MYSFYNGNAQNYLKSDDWKLGIQAWSLHLGTFAEALDKADSCGVKYIEGFPPQEIGAGLSGTMDYHMSPETQRQVLALFSRKGIKMVSYAVVSPTTDSHWVQLFKFAKAMGLLNIVSEPEQSQIPFISRPCNEYKINVAIYDHAKPTRYWNPNIVLSAIEGASPCIGSCADIGYWLESGVIPVDCLKRLKGHIVQFHLKDENMKSARPGFHDVPMGEGVIDMAKIMKMMERQHWKGYCFIEYEYHFGNNAPDIKTCVEYFREERGRLLDH